MRLKTFPAFCFCLLVALSGLCPVQGTAADSTACPLYTSFLMGGWQDGAWKPAEEIASFVADGAALTLYGFSGKTGTATSKSPRIEEGPGTWWSMEMKTSTGGTEPAEGEIAIGGTWNAMPRASKRQTGGLEAYEKEVRQMLAKNGLEKSPVVLSEVVRSDLNGDGSEEVLIVAQSADASVPAFKKGTYTIVLFRHLVKGKVETVVLQENYYQKDVSGEASSPENFSCPFIIDANGDGVMELILKGRYYEGAWYEIYEYKNNTLNKVLSEGVGA